MAAQANDAQQLEKLADEAQNYVGEARILADHAFSLIP